MSKSKKPKPLEQVEGGFKFEVVVPYSVIVNAAKAILNQEWSRQDARKWLRGPGIGFLKRAHQNNIEDVVRMTMAFMKKQGAFGKGILVPKAPKRPHIVDPDEEGVGDN